MSIKGFVFNSIQLMDLQFQMKSQLHQRLMLSPTAAYFCKTGQIVEILSRSHLEI